MRIFLVLISIFYSCFALADFDKGMAAYAKKDYATALVEFEKAAAQGHLEAQYKLGSMSYYGYFYGTTPDYLKAFEWIQKAAEQGYAAAQYRLGFMYTYGQGVKQDYSKTLEWYQKAAEQGYAKAQRGIIDLDGNKIRPGDFDAVRSTMRN